MIYINRNLKSLPLNRNLEYLHIKPSSPNRYLKYLPLKLMQRFRLLTSAAGDSCFSYYRSPSHFRRCSSILLPERSPSILLPERPKILLPERPKILRPERPKILRPERPKILRPERPKILRPERPKILRTRLCPSIVLAEDLTNPLKEFEKHYLNALVHTDHSLFQILQFTAGCHHSNSTTALTSVQRFIGDFGQSSCVREEKVIKHGKSLKLKWQPPAPSYWKWNFDGSYLPNVGKAFVGVVARNSDGIARFYAFGEVDAISSTEAEFLAAYKALCIAAHVYQRQKIVLEGDSLEVVKAINNEILEKGKRKKDELFERYNAVFKKILPLKKCFDIVVVHVPGDVNRAADYLASYVASSKCCELLKKKDNVPSIASLFYDFDCCVLQKKAFEARIEKEKNSF